MTIKTNNNNNNNNNNNINTEVMPVKIGTSGTISKSYRVSTKSGNCRQQPY
jgi:hypothetical protein